MFLNKLRFGILALTLVFSAASLYSQNSKPTDNCTKAVRKVKCPGSGPNDKCTQTITTLECIETNREKAAAAAKAAAAKAPVAAKPAAKPVVKKVAEKTPAPKPVEKTVAVPAPVVQCDVNTNKTAVENIDGKGALRLSVAAAINTQRQRGTRNIGAGTATVSSKFKPTIMWGAEYMFKENTSIFTNIMMNNVNFNQMSSYTLSQTTDSTIGADIGLNYYFNEWIGMTGYFGYQQDYAHFMTSATTGEMQRFGHGLIGFGALYRIVKWREFLFTGQTGFELYFPETTANFTTEMGHQINTELDLGAKINRHLITSFFRFEYSKLRASSWTEQYGFNWIIGLKYILAVNIL